MNGSKKLSRSLICLLGLGCLVVLLTLSGCRIGMGVGFEFRVGYIYFESTDDLVHGALLLDGHHIGTLEPLGRIRHLTTLDFRHLLELVSPNCPEGLCTWMLEPPLSAGEIVYLSLPLLAEE